MAPSSTRSGFTLIELVIVMGILSVLFTFFLSYILDSLNDARLTRAEGELNQFQKATLNYVIENGGEWPGDVDRGLPPGIEEYLGPGSWPYGPWPGSEYDWDAYVDSSGDQVYQVSIRFCPLGEPELCQFPDEPWAADFDYHSSVYFCIQGPCRAHPNQPIDHPGYCINCR